MEKREFIFISSVLLISLLFLSSLSSAEWYNPSLGKDKVGKSYTVGRFLGDLFNLQTPINQAKWSLGTAYNAFIVPAINTAGAAIYAGPVLPVYDTAYGTGFRTDLLAEQQQQYKDAVAPLGPLPFGPEAAMAIRTIETIGPMANTAFRAAISSKSTPVAENVISSITPKVTLSPTAIPTEMTEAYSGTNALVAEHWKQFGIPDKTYFYTQTAENGAGTISEKVLTAARRNTGEIGNPRAIEIINSKLSNDLMATGQYTQEELQQLAGKGVVVKVEVPKDSIVQGKYAAEGLDSSSALVPKNRHLDELVTKKEIIGNAKVMEIPETNGGRGAAIRDFITGQKDGEVVGVGSSKVTAKSLQENLDAAGARVDAAKEALKTAQGSDLETAKTELYYAQKAQTEAIIQSENYLDLTLQEKLLKEKTSLNKMVSTPARDARIKEINDELGAIEKRTNERNPYIRGRPGSAPGVSDEVMNAEQARNAPTTDQSIAAARKETGDAMKIMLKSDVDSPEYKMAEAKWIEATKKIKELEGGNPYLPIQPEPSSQSVLNGKTQIAGVVAGGAALTTTNTRAGESDPALKAARTMTGHAVFGYGR